MNITVTTPLEMGVGQQKYVVAYTLKQNIVEKQPDILNAQKTENIHSLKDTIQKLSSPATIRPDALFVSKSMYNYEQKFTTNSQQNTLKKNHEFINTNSINNHIPSSNLMSINVGGASSCTSDNTNQDYEKPFNYSKMYNDCINNTQIERVSENNLYNNSLECEKILDYRLLNNNTSTATNEPLFLNSNCITTMGNASTIPHIYSPSQQQLLGDYRSKNNEIRYSTSEFAGEASSTEYNNLNNQITSTMSNMNSTLYKSRNRNHIITDTLPGPESCV